MAGAAEQYKAAVAAAVYQEAVQVANVSVKQVPVDTGRLRASFWLAPPESLDNPVVRAGYGTDYALYVHERTDVSHAKRQKGGGMAESGKAKFLEDPINDAKSGWADRVAERAKENIKNGVGLSGCKSTYKENPE
jgi:hypothetical protein